jgi:asparagine synthase (glutamine-hydrolysing)
VPGIAAIISKNPCKENEIAIDAMANCMKHEGFHKAGSYEDRDNGVYLGWAIHEGSFSDCMPIFNEKKNIVMIFYGENHIEKSRLDELKRKNHRFDQWNASQIIHFYEEADEAFLSGLNGWFSGVLLDLRNGKCIVFNDRYGMQRLYYYEGRDSIFLASEAKALLKIHPQLREIPDERMAEYLYCRCVLQDRSLFKNVNLLPGGSRWVFEKGTCVKKGSYFAVSEIENQPMLEKESFYIKLRDTFRRILPRYVRSKEPIALSLTGGLDTRMILACMDIPTNRMRAYTHSGLYRDNYDVKVGREIAGACGIQHEVLRLDEGFLTDFPRLAEKTVYLSDGSMDLTGAPSLYLHGKSRNLGSIRLTGNFGGQVLRGIIDLKAAPIRKEFLDNDFGKNLDRAAAIFGEVAGGHPLSFFLFKQAPWYNYGRFVLEQSQLTQRSPFMDNELVEVVYQAPPRALSSKEITMRLIAEGNPALSRIPTDRGIGWSKTLPGSNALHFYREALFKAEYYISYGMPQWLAKIDTFIGPALFDALFLERHKYYNIRKWYRYYFANYIREILLDPRTANRGIFDKRRLEQIVIGHTNGTMNCSSMINLVLTVELTYRLLADRAH